MAAAVAPPFSTKRSIALGASGVGRSKPAPKVLIVRLRSRRRFRPRFRRSGRSRPAQAGSGAASPPPKRLSCGFDHCGGFAPVFDEAVARARRKRGRAQQARPQDAYRAASITAAAVSPPFSTKRSIALGASGVGRSKPAPEVLIVRPRSRRRRFRPRFRRSGDRARRKWGRAQQARPRSAYRAASITAAVVSPPFSTKRSIAPGASGVGRSKPAPEVLIVRPRSRRRRFRPRFR